MMNRPIYHQFIVFRGFMEALAGTTTRKSRSSTGNLRSDNPGTTEGTLQSLGKVNKHIYSNRLTCQVGRVLHSISSYISPMNAFRQRHANKG